MNGGTTSFQRDLEDPRQGPPIGLKGAPSLSKVDLLSQRKYNFSFLEEDIFWTETTGRFPLGAVIMIGEML